MIRIPTTDSCNKPTLHIGATTMIHRRLMVPSWVFYLTICMMVSNGVEIFHKIFKNFRNFIFHVHIWNQHEKYIKMDTNKPMFGPVVLEIACDIFVNKPSSYHSSM